MTQKQTEKKKRKNQGKQDHPVQFTSVDPALNPEQIFKRGFVLKAETEATNLSRFATKVNMVDAKGEHEGIWAALITEEDGARYNNDASRGETIRAVLLNDSLFFSPRTWGRVIEGKTNGTTRPVFKREDQIERFKATHGAYMREFPPPPEEKK